MFDANAGFVLGANLPWHRYGCDFGTNSWQPDGGIGAVVASGDHPLLTIFANLRAADVHLVRWFLYCDGRAGITFDSDGCPTGLDPTVFRDLDAALDLAARFDIRLVLALFDYLWCGRAEMAGGVMIKGRRRVLAHASTRAALIDRVVAPLVARYGSHATIAAWDVMNEPEWAVLGVGTLDPRRAIRRGTMRAFIADVADLVHGRATQPVTVGSAHASWLGLVQGLGLDFYQVHWYDRLDTRLPLTTPVVEFGLDRPVVLGELPTRGSAWRAADVIETAKRMGYAGAWVWSMRADDGASDPEVALATLRRQNGTEGKKTSGVISEMTPDVFSSGRP